MCTFLCSTPMQPLLPTQRGRALEAVHRSAPQGAPCHRGIAFGMVVAALLLWACIGKEPQRLLMTTQPSPHTQVSGSAWPQPVRAPQAGAHATAGRTTPEVVAERDVTARSGTFAPPEPRAGTEFPAPVVLLGALPVACALYALAKSRWSALAGPRAARASGACPRPLMAMAAVAEGSIRDANEDSDEEADGAADASEDGDGDGGATTDAVAAPGKRKVKVRRHRGGLPYITLSHSSGAQARLFVHGAAVFSYTDAAGTEWLAMRDDAVLDGTQPVLGGLTLAFPQFGPGDLLDVPFGFARGVPWAVRDFTGDSVTLVLRPSEATQRVWDYQFRCTYRIEVLEYGLHTELVVENLEPRRFFEFQPGWQACTSACP